MTDQRISVMSPSGLSTLHVLEFGKLHFEKGRVWARLSAPDLGITEALPGLRRQDLRELRNAVAHQIRVLEESLEVQPTYDAALHWWQGFQGALEHHRRRRRWLPEEVLVKWEASLADLKAKHHVDGGHLRVLIEQSTPEQREALRLFDSAWSARECVAQQNQALFDIELRDEREFFDRIEKTPLTDEQARAVICFDNRVQLVAAAGSGKTSTMVAKAGWTIRKGIARSDEILLLAFNKAAAAEVGERCTTRFAKAGIAADGLQATTFHAFGLRVIGEATGAKPRLAAGLDVDNGLGLLADVVAGLRRTSFAFAANWSLFQNVLGMPISGQIEAEPDAWDPRAGRSGFRNLNLDIMKSAGERAIANWLIKSGVDFEYERPYEIDVADAHHSQYQPDFFYPSAGIYHEHWALVPGQSEPAGFEGYLQSSAWKKELHSTHGTVLIETAARDLVDGKIFDELDRQLRAYGIEPRFDPDRPVPGKPMLTDREMLTLFRTFLSHAKSNRLGAADLRSRVTIGRRGTPDPRERLFLDLFDEVRRAWDERLRQANEIDFEDMLNQATDIIETGRWTSPYKVVLVDEFQDASHSRARLVRALVQPSGRFLFAVGDDWQSIYRFAGSDISAMTRFRETFGAGHVLRLERTFRGSQQLSTLAGDFVMKNPHQLRKEVWSEKSLESPVVLALVNDESDLRDVIHQRLVDLSQAVEPLQTTSVKILGRYKNERDLVPRARLPGVEVSFQTVHSSKGLEADHVIIPGLNQGSFPSGKTDDPLLNLALPVGDDFPHSEERRLFYVALTRARESVLLIAKAGRESEFVTELLADGCVTLFGETETQEGPAVCQKCGKGLMVLRQGNYGPFLACNRFPACTSTKRLEP